MQPIHAPNQRLATAIVLLTLATVAHLLTQTLAMLALRSASPITLVGSAIAAPPARLHGDDPPDPRAILARNIFDVATGSLWPPKPPPGPTPVSVAAPSACEGSLRLVGTWFSEHAPERSLASVSSGATAALAYREGDALRDKQALHITPSSVLLRASGGALCELQMFTDGHEAKPLPPQPVEASPTAFTVKRSLVDRLLHDPQTHRGIRVVPHEEAGQVIGLKVYGIRRQSELAELGVQNGDLLRTVNGYELGSPGAALEAYTKLRSVRNLSVELTRAGRELALSVAIDDAD